MKKLKIALVSPYDVAYPGGVTEHMLALAAALRRQGHTVHILAICSNYQNRRLVDVEVVTRQITMVPIAGTVARVALSPFNYFKIRRFLQAEAFDVIHLQEPLTPSITWLVLLQASAFPRTVTIGTFHAYHERPNWFYANGRPLFGYFFTKLDSLIAVSEAARDFAQQMFTGDYKIIPNGIDLKRFGVAQPVPPTFPQGGEKSGVSFIEGEGEAAPINILFVGRLDARKGFRCLLDSFIALQPDYPRLRLTVIGPFRPKDCRIYQQVAQSYGVTNVDFVGYVSPERLPDFYRRADIFCAPSIGYESFGIVLLEAMAAGLPIVASDIAGYRSVLNHGQEGLLVPPGEPALLATALRHLISNPQQRAQMGQRGWQKAQRYSWEQVVEDIVDVYRHTIEAKLTFACPVTPTIQAQQIQFLGSQHSQHPQTRLRSASEAASPLKFGAAEALETGRYPDSIGQGYPK